MFFRGRQPETSIWRRFRAAADGFVFLDEGQFYSARILANAERIVDLFHALLAQLPPAVDVEVEDFRVGGKWEGKQLPLEEVREAIARIQQLVAAHAGVEITVHSAEDQVTLNPVLEIFIYAYTDQWLYILQGKGLEERRMMRSRSWKLKEQSFPPAPELSDAIATMASSLGLQPA